MHINVDYKRKIIKFSEVGIKVISKAVAPNTMHFGIQILQMQTPIHMLPFLEFETLGGELHITIDVRMGCLLVTFCFSLLGVAFFLSIVLSSLSFVYVFLYFFHSFFISFILYFFYSFLPSLFISVILSFFLSFLSQSFFLFLLFISLYISSFSFVRIGLC